MRTAHELQTELVDKLGKVMILQAQIASIRATLQATCDHAATESYEWEHDNGYGRQTMITGKRCVFCLKVDRWNRGTFYEQ